MIFSICIKSLFQCLQVAPEGPVVMHYMSTHKYWFLRAEITPAKTIIFTVKRGEKSSALRLNQRHDVGQFDDLPRTNAGL